jgi:uncharacterized membrane protein YhaH (DUF805 family)
MKNFWKIFLVFLFCGTPAFIIKTVLNYDFQMSGIDTIFIFIAIIICAYLGLIPNKIIDKKRK